MCVCVCVCVCVYLVGWLVGWVYGISTFVGYLMPNLFHANNQFYFKLFSLVKLF